MIDRLTQWAHTRGYFVAWGPLELVEAVQKEVASFGTSGVLEKEFYASELGSIAQPQATRADGLRSVVMVVKPRPAHVTFFEVDGRRLEVVVPPTYVRYRPLFEEVAEDLRANALLGARVERLMAPLKLLAVRFGLVRYGRNNLTYAPGMGSFIQLLGYLTDAVLPQPTHCEPCDPTLLPECDACGACRAVCPTGAIDEERVLLHAERCLTYANENAGPWPDWVPSQAHECLLGCLSCQRACPANPELPLESSGVAFNGEETEALLADTGDHSASVWAGIRDKLAQLGQPYAEPVVGRNLKALLAAAGKQANAHLQR
jgi:epoxyqueuosine reductase